MAVQRLKLNLKTMNILTKAQIVEIAFRTQLVDTEIDIMVRDLSIADCIKNMSDIKIIMHFKRVIGLELKLFAPNRFVIKYNFH
jgi:hypothetical protein